MPNQMRDIFLKSPPPSALETNRESQAAEANESSVNALHDTKSILAARRKIKADYSVASQGFIDCPACGGDKALYFHTHVNGHVCGNCETKGCFEWT